MLIIYGNFTLLSNVFCKKQQDFAVSARIHILFMIFSFFSFGAIRGIIMNRKVCAGPVSWICRVLCKKERAK